MVYKSKFTYVDVLPADCKKISQIGKYFPKNLFWSKVYQTFYVVYENREKHNVRQLIPHTDKNLVYCTSVDGRNICVSVNKWIKQFNKIYVVNEPEQYWCNEH